MKATRLLISGLAALCLILTVATSCGQRKLNATPPVAKVVPHVDTVHGQVLTDNYFWLRDKENPEVIAYLEAENAYTDSMLKHTETLQEKLYQEILSRIKETDLSVPVKDGPYYYYSRTEEGKQYSIYCRKKGSLDAAEEVLLDINELAEGKDFASLGAYEISPDHKLLAYAMDFEGNERYTLRVKNLTTGELFDDEIKGIATSVEWGNDNQTLFYTVHDDAWRPYKLFRHKLGADPAGDVEVYHEANKGFWLGLGKTKDERFLMLVLGSETSHEWHFLDADNPTGRFRVIQPRTPKLEYSVAHHGDRFFILTNDGGAVNFKLMSAPESRPGRSHWVEEIPARDNVKIDDVECFRDHMVIYAREDGLQQIDIRNFENGQTHRIEFDEPVYSVYSSSNPDFNRNILRFSYQSMVTPRSVYDYNMDSRERELLKQREVLGGYDSDRYRQERIWATANDGTEVPISMVYKKGMKRDGSNPLYLYGYGAYGISMDPWFSSARLSLLNRGFIFAIPHIRGGGEMGRPWYEDGKWFNKMNTFTDFIACGEHLIHEKYTSHEKLIISGGSAGGLLVGAVLNMRPDLAGIAVAEVPFVDVINTMLDETIPLTVVEYEEWGNPNEKDYFDYMYSYSPYDNVGAFEYPDMLVIAGLNDTRVQYWEPAKWVAKLRANKTGDNLLLMKTNMGAGHGGASGRYDRLRELAMEYAFLLDRLDMRS